MRFIDVKWMLFVLFTVFLFFFFFSLATAQCVDWSGTDGTQQFDQWCCDNSDYIPVLIEDWNTGYCCPSDYPYISSDKNYCLQFPPQEQQPDQVTESPHPQLFCCRWWDDGQVKYDWVYAPSCTDGLGVHSVAGASSSCPDDPPTQGTSVAVSFWQSLINWFKNLFSKLGFGNFVRVNGGGAK